MSQPHPEPDVNDEAAAETEALGRAIAEARADPREVPHAEVRAWLLKVAAGKFDAVHPVPRILDR